MLKVRGQYITVQVIQSWFNTFIRFPITFFLTLDLGEALVPEAAAGMEKGSASIIIEQKIFYIWRWKYSDSLSHSQIRRLLSCSIFKKVSPPSDNAFHRGQYILRFSLIKECLYFHTCFVRQKSPKTLATIGTLYSTCTMDGGEHTSFFDYFPLLWRL